MTLREGSNFDRRQMTIAGLQGDKRERSATVEVGQTLITWDVASTAPCSSHTGSWTRYKKLLGNTETIGQDACKLKLPPSTCYDPSSRGSLKTMHASFSPVPEDCPLLFRKIAHRQK